MASRSVRDIVDELAYLPGYMQHGTLGERNKMMTELFQELYDKNITLPAQQRRATGRLQHRPQKAAANQPATIVEKPVATPEYRSQRPLPLRKWKEVQALPRPDGDCSLASRIGLECDWRLLASEPDWPGVR